MPFVINNPKQTKVKLSLSILALLSCLVSNAQDTAPNWSLAGNSTATSSSKLGTTNSIPLRLFTNNLERLRIDAATGKVAIGTSFFKGRFTLFNNGSTPASSWVTTANPLFTGYGETTGGNSDFFLLMASNTITSRPNIIGRRARGTLATPMAVVKNDFISSLQASGYDGSAFQNAANVDFFVDGTPSAGNVPMRIAFSTGSNINNRSERLRIGSTGNIAFNNTQMFLQQATGYLGLGKIPSFNLDVLGKGRFSDKMIVGVDANDINNAGLEIIAKPTGEGAFYIKDNSNQSYLGGFAINGARNAVVANYDSTKDIGLFAGNAHRMIVKANGNVGIGIALPNSQLDVRTNTQVSAIHAFNLFKGPSNYSGLLAYSENAPGYGYGVSATGGQLGIIAKGAGGDYTGMSTGVLGIASGTAGYRTGVFGEASGGSRNYGVYGYAYGGGEYGFTAAGYFNGDVWAATYNTFSDRRLKEDIQPLQTGLNGLMKLKPKTYTFKTNTFESMHLPKSKQLGLLADEVKAVFPELVTTAVHPAEYDETTGKEMSPEIKFEGINYQGLIPVLVASIQEQQGIIEKQQQQIDELKAIVRKLAQGSNYLSLSHGSLGAATPNPVNGSATISYSLPEGSRTAHIVVTDMKGSLIRQVNLSSKGSGQIQLNTASFSAGTYMYSLFVDGNKVDTKQLLVAR